MPNTYIEVLICIALAVICIQLFIDVLAIKRGKKALQNVVSEAIKRNLIDDFKKQAVKAGWHWSMQFLIKADNYKESLEARGLKSPKISIIKNRNGEFTIVAHAFRRVCFLFKKRLFATSMDDFIAKTKVFSKEVGL